MSTKQSTDPTVRAVDYIPTSATNGPRSSAQPVYDDWEVGKDSVVIENQIPQVKMTTELSKEVDRLQKQYNSQRTNAHHAEIRRKGNLSIMKLLGITLLTYIYMGLAVLLSRNEEVNL